MTASRYLKTFLLCGVLLYLFQVGVLLAESRPLVTVTTGIIADMVKNVGGDRIEVKALMGPGVDPHLYKATHGDLKALSDARLVFFNGLHLEGKMQEVLEGLKKRKPVVALSDALDPLLLRQPPEFSGLYDPHIWFNVALWGKTIPLIRDQLSLLIPEEKTYFAARAESFAGELASLDLWVRQQVEAVPAPQRVLITAHDAFGYFGAAYGFEVAGLQGISTASEFGLADIQRLVELITTRSIKAIFVETSVPERFIASIQQGVEARGGKVAIGGTLYSDALGEGGSGAESYQGMVKKNIQTITGALK